MARGVVAAVQATPHHTPQGPASVFGQGPSAEAGHRSQIRIRDPFVLPDRQARVYYVYGQPNRQIERARFFEMDDSGDLLRIVGERGRSR